MIQVLFLTSHLTSIEKISGCITILEKAGFTKITLAGKASLDEMQDYFLEHEPADVNISFLEMGEEDIFGSLKVVFDKTDCSQILMIDVSQFFAIDFSWFVESSHSICSIALRLVEEVDQETIQIDQRYYIDPNLSRETREGYINGGVYLFKREILAEELDNDAVIAELVEKKLVQGIPCGGQIVTDTEAYLKTDDFKPCLFLDRDGIIIKDTGYPHKIEEIEILEEIIPMIKWANAQNWLVIVVTNQAGIAKSKFREEDFYACSEYIERKLQEEGASIDDTFFCPYHKEGIVSDYAFESLLRKPHPGLVLSAMNEYKIDIKKSLMIGDKDSDRLKIPGLRTLLLLGQYPLEKSSSIFSTHEEILHIMRQA